MYNTVKEYYGKTLKCSNDLKTNACCTDIVFPDYIKKALVNVHDEVLARNYGCGLVAPQALNGLNILDLGCGTGRDCYVLSQLVGAHGLVVGVDMTDEQLEVAESYIDYHREKFGYSVSNVVFKNGFIERLDELQLSENFFDIIVSNCVINLSPDKNSVFKNAYRFLKPGEEMYFSDVYADRRIPEDLVNDPELYSECLSGALYWNDFLTIAKESGFKDPRLIDSRPLVIENKYFEFIGTTNNHYGIFRGCGVSIPFYESAESSVETHCC